VIARRFRGLYGSGMTRLFPFVLAVAVAGCSNLAQVSEPAPDVAANPDQVRPLARPAGLGRVVPQEARTVEQFDVTTTEEREAAAAVPAAAAEARLGTTVASLGDPAQAGFWIKTPLVEAQGKGRVVYPGTGKSVQVDLIPIDGAATAGSRLSLAAFRIIEAPLTGLPEVEVFSGG